jgi:hypothetical protein
MCRISKLSDDWVVKGFHLHVYAIELAMHPDHLGGIVFSSLFSGISQGEAGVAIKRARELLHEPEWRNRFYREARRARDFVRRHSGRMAPLAHGRAAEFHFLMVALRRLGVTHE